MLSQRLSSVPLTLCVALAAACSAADPAAGEVEQTSASQNEQQEQQLPSAPSQVAGGQSGGQSGSMLSSLECYCGFEGVALAQVVSGDARGHCAVFELVEKPEGVSDYHGLEVGDEFGGSGQLLCGLGLDLEPGRSVYVQYTPGQQATALCDAYRDCHESQCGSISEFSTNPQTDPEGYAAEEAAWEECLAQCAASTRDACSAGFDVARFSGHVVVAARGDGGEVMYVDREGDTYALDDTSGLSATSCDAEATLVAEGDPPETPMTFDENGEEVDFFDAPPESCDVP